MEQLRISSIGGMCPVEAEGYAHTFRGDPRRAGRGLSVGDPRLRHTRVSFGPRTARRIQYLYFLSPVSKTPADSEHGQGGHYGFGDPVFPVGQLPVLRTYPEFEDVPTDLPISVYSLNEIAAEKIVALQDRARNEPRRT